MSNPPDEHINLQGILPFYHLDDIAFKLALYEPSHGSVHFDSNRLESLHWPIYRSVS